MGVALTDPQRALPRTASYGVKCRGVVLLRRALGGALAAGVACVTTMDLGKLSRLGTVLSFWEAEGVRPSHNGCTQLSVHLYTSKEQAARGTAQRRSSMPHRSTLLLPSTRLSILSHREKVRVTCCIVFVVCSFLDHVCLEGACYMFVQIM